MGTPLSTTLRLVDQMTAPIMSINRALDNMSSRFNAVESASDINATSLAHMRHQVDTANFAAEQLNQHFQLVESNIDQMTQGQGRLNDSINKGTSNASGLVKKLSAAVATYASIQKLGSALALSDEMASLTARLNVMNDGLQTTAELQDKIFLSAQRSRAVYADTANMVATLGTQAKNAFSSNDELIAFAEQLNKQFVIAGTRASSVESTMYNLTQALASGVLRGQDLNAVMSNAQPILETVANYMGVGVENIRDMAAEGQLSAVVIKNALLSAADETNAKFEQMPMTFGQVATSIKNQALMQFQPILKKLNDIANSPAFQTLTNNVINAVVVLSGVVTGIFGMIAGIAQFANDNWGILAPIIGVATTMLLGYVAALAAYNISQGIANGLKAVSALRDSVAAAKAGLATGATFAQTAAQHGLNAALLACPLTWILIAVIAIIGAIYLVIGIVNKLAGTSVSATGIIFEAFFMVGAFLWNLFLGLLELVLGIVNALINPFINFANFLGNIFTNPISAIIYQFQNMADSVLGVLQSIASAMDFIFGSNMADTIAGWRSGLKDMADAVVAEYAPNENYQTIMDNLDLTVEGLGLSRWAYGDARDAGYATGSNLEESFKSFELASLFENNIPTASDYAGGYDFSGIDAISSGVNDIAANTGNQLDYSEEELKLWRDIAERDTVNRFTTAEVHVDFGGITNNVNSEMDLDGIVDYIAENVEETLQVVAGVHA